MEIARIVDQMERGYSGDAWHGPPLRKLLDGVDAATAANHGVADAHSIWELTEHIAFWLTVVRRRLAGEIVGDEGDWRPVGEPSPDRWNHALAELDAAHKRLAATARTLSDADLERVVPVMGYTNYVMLHGVVQHTLYHAGQIALLLHAPAGRR